MNKYLNVAQVAKQKRDQKDREFERRRQEAFLDRNPYYFLLTTDIQAIFKYLSQD